MADANGRTPNDPYYDQSTETDPSQSAGTGPQPGGAYGAQPPVQSNAPGAYYTSPANGQGNGQPYNPSDPSTWTTGTAASGVVPYNASAGKPTSASGPPTGGSLQDPAYVNSLIAYYAGLPGADPSLAANPQYWAQKVLSGEFGTDQAFVVDKFQNAWKTPGAPGNATSTGIDQSYLQPFGESFNYGKFDAPSAADVQNQPGYQFARDQTLQAFTNTKAAQGLFNSGGTINDLAGLASNFANTYYNDDFNRSLNAYNTNENNAWQQYLGRRDTFYANQNNPFSKLLQAGTLGYNAAANTGG